MRRALICSLAALAALAAHSPEVRAFCGTYVGGSGELYNSVSRVVLARFDGRTTITMANDITGDTTDFAVIVPVPNVPGADDVAVVDPDVIDRFDTYSEPREVSYRCEDFYNNESDADTDSDTDSDTDADTDSDTDVDVEAQYIVGEYDVVILSADESGNLITWLNDNGYAVPTASEALLQEYIDGGSNFFAAKVDADAEIESGDMLSPLQISYEADTWALPLRLGTLNSPGSQDLIVYTLNDYSDGEAGISTYDEATVEDGCMYDHAEEHDSFESWYTDRLATAHEQPGLNWVVEYSWGNAGCDPCSDAIPDGDDAVTVGVPEDRAHYSEYWLTRMHLRYAPQEVETALGFYHSGIRQTRQQRYIQYDEVFEEFFEVCDVGWVEADQTCLSQDEDESGSANPSLDDDDDDGNGSRGGGCAGGSAAGLLLVLGAGRLRRRRD